ncbi:hypothetical protein [Methylobacterium sp. CM6246]
MGAVVRELVSAVVFPAFREICRVSAVSFGAKAELRSKVLALASSDPCIVEQGNQLTFQGICRALQRTIAQPQQYRSWRLSETPTGVYKGMI